MAPSAIEATTNAAFSIDHVSAHDLKKAVKKINTGIGFFDHMLDQLNSHAQIGIAVQVASDLSADLGDKNRHASCDQKALVEITGNALGKELGNILIGCETKTDAALPAGKRKRDGDSTCSRFCCPLDEALVECTITYPPIEGLTCGVGNFALAPYGVFPKSGRSEVGHWKTDTVEHFFDILGKSMGAHITLNKLRGHNGHHIVESSFKAFSRALRNLIDIRKGKPENVMWGADSESFQAGVATKREASLARKTKETSISVDLKLDGLGNVNVSSGVKAFDGLLTEIAQQSGITLQVDCNGDLWVDDHHTTEDVSIAVGKVLNQALGSKGGLNRMWTSSATEGDAKVEVVMDLSNRPCLTHDLDLSLHDEEKVDDISIEMIEHVFDSLVMNGQMTVHIVQVQAGKAGELTTATARAFGKALGRCIAVDPRRAGATASSKGTLSV